MTRNYTTNLNLVKPDKTDQYNVADFNDNMDKLDNWAGLVPPRALTADKLTTARNINGVAFDGSQNIINGLWFYSSTETYNEDYIVYGVVDDVIKMYRSLADNNVGNPLTDETKWQEISLGGGAGLEVLDIGIAPCGIDEPKNKRRYLNGQVIMQDQFPVFTSKLKARVGWNTESETATLLPNLVKTETEWQAIKAASVYGQVGAFVIDDDAGTIRLPAVVNIQGLFDLQNAGLTVEAGLPNIRGQIDYRNVSTGSQSCFEGYTNQGSGAFAGCQSTGNIRGIADFPSNVTQIGLFDFNASNSNSTYSDDCETVQVESIQYPYFIQVATGAEYEEPVINEYTVTSAYSYGMSQYYPGIMNNNAWLRSNGQWNSGDVYVGLYNWILEQVNSGVEGFKGVGYAYTSGDDNYYISTATPTAGATVYGDSNGVCLPITTVTTISENSISFTNGADSVTATRSSTNDKAITDDYWITDYDYVINTTNETFRLPLLDGSEELPGDKYTTVELGASLTKYTAPANGYFVLARSEMGSYTYLYLENTTTGLGFRLGNNNGAGSNDNLGSFVPCKRGDVVQINYSGGILDKFRFIYAQGNGNLYYYCGNVEQNTQLVNVARIEEKLVDLVDLEKAANASMPSTRYIDLTLGASGSSYTAPADGWVCLMKGSTAANQYVTVEQIIDGKYLRNMSIATANGQNVATYLPVAKGASFMTGYTAAGVLNTFRFYYAQGAKND